MSSFLRLAAARAPLAARTTAIARPLSTSARASFPRKDTMDKDSLNPQPTEYAKGGGDQAAAQSDAAFDPKTTDPEAQVQQSKDSLESSPGDHKYNQGKSEEVSGSSQSAGPRNQSGEKSSGGKSTGKKVN